MDENVGKGHHPNSRKNLKPVKKGQVLNPEGARAHDPHKKALKNLTIESLREVIEAAMTGNLQSLAAIANDPDTPAIQVGVAKVLHKGISEGDWDIVEKLLARLIGKVPDKIDHTNAGGAFEHKPMTVTFVRPPEKK